MSDACPDESVLRDAIDGALPLSCLETLEDHLNQCARCRALAEAFTSTQRFADEFDTALLMDPQALNVVRSIAATIEDPRRSSGKPQGHDNDGA